MTRDTGLGHADHMVQGAFPITATQSFLTKADSRYFRFVTWRNCHGQQGGSRPAVVDLHILVSCAHGGLSTHAMYTLRLFLQCDR